MDLLHLLEDTLDEVQGDTVTLPRGVVREIARRLAMDLLHLLEDTLDEVQGDTVTLPRGVVRKMVNVLRVAQRAAGMMGSAPASAQVATPAEPTLAKVIVQALVAIQTAPQPWSVRPAERDFSIQSITDRVLTIMAEVDPGVRLHPRHISKACSEELGLTRRQRHSRTRRETVLVGEGELRALAERYGVAWPGEEGKR